MARSKKTAVKVKSAKPRGGHPANPNITPERIEQIFALMREGNSFKSACEQVCLPRVSVLDRINADTVLSDKYARSKEQGLEYKIDTLFDKIQNEPDVQRARLYADTLKWLISKVLPKLYGDKLQVSADVKADVKNSVSADFVALFLSKFKGGENASK